MKEDELNRLSKKESNSYSFDSENHISGKQYNQPVSIDPKTIPYDDYKELLKEKADIEAKLESQKSSNHSLQSQLSKIKKEKGVSSEPITEEAPKEAPDARYLELQKKIDELSTQLTQTVTKSDQKSPPVVSVTPSSSTTTGNSHNLEVPAAVSVAKVHPEHNFKIFQAGCTTCGTKNEKFVPEMKCKNCKGTVGSFEAVKDMDYCPYCTEKLTAIPITEEAVRKVKEYLQTPKVAIPV